VGPTVLLLAAVLALAGGCGGSSDGERRRPPARPSSPATADPAATARGLVASVRTGRYGELWSALAPAQQRVFSRARFESCLRRAVASLPFPLAEIPISVLGVRRSGQRAEVGLRADTPVGPLRRELTLVRVGGVWRAVLPRDLAGALGSCPGG